MSGSTGAPELSAKAPDLRKTAARGFLWNGGQALVSRVASLAGFVVLARLLDPSEYGVVALANVFTAFFVVFASAGYSQALVQLPEVDKKDLDTIFWISLGSSIVLAIVVSVAAFPLADAFGEPELRPLLQVLSTAFIFVALGGTHQAVLQRRLEFRPLAARTVVANVVSTVVGIAFAYAGFGAWALVAQTVVAIALTSLGAMLVSGYRPSLYVSLARFWPIFAFSRNFMGGTLMTYLTRRSDDFFVGAFLGSAALGIYAVAYRVLTVMIEMLVTTIGQVAFPIFSRLQGEKARLRAAYASSVRMGASTAVPIFMFTLAAAPEIVHVVFGQKWDAAVPVMQVLCLFGVQHAIITFNGSLLQAVGRARFIFRLAVVGNILQVIGFLVAVKFGLTWVAAALVIRAYLMAPIALVAAARELDTTVWATMRGVVGPCLSTGVMVGAVFACKSVLGDMPDAARLAALMGVALATYLAALRLLSGETFSELAGYLRNMVERGAGAPQTMRG